MEQLQIGGNRSRIILFALIISLSLSACADKSYNDNVVTTNDNEEVITTVTTADTTDTQPETAPAETKPVIELTSEDLPELLPDVLKLREKEYDDMPYLDTQEQLSEYVLWNFLYGRTECEFRLPWELSYNVSAVALEQACEEAMSYYLFSAYQIWDMMTEDDGDPNSVYGKIKLVYEHPEYDLEARLAAYSYVVNNPPPEGGFSDYDEERSYAKKIHDYVAFKVTYDPMGYDPKSMEGKRGYEGLQEAYNVLGKNQETVVCAGYARAFALICQYAGINCAWVRGNQTEESSHAWNVIYPCDGSEPVLVDVTWDDLSIYDFIGQTEVDYSYFYIPLSSEYEHTAEEDMAGFIEYLNQ